MPADVVIETRVFNVGGSYGNKQEMTLMCLYTALLSRLTGHPVRFRMNKEDQLTIHEMRLGSRFTARFSIKDGIMTSVKGHWYVMPGYTDDAGYCITAVGLGEMQVALAKCQNWDIDTCMYATNTISCGTVRGFGGQELKSAMMPVIAHMLADMNLDPVQFFHDNFVCAGDRYMWRDCNWWTCHEVDYRQAILEAAEKFGWKEKFKGWYKPTAVNGSKRIGVGVSIHGNGDVGEDNSEAIVRLHTNGSVILNQSLVESGQGQRAACAKMVAEVLNVPFESVTVTNTGTVDNPVEFGLCGSRGTLTSGTAATRAARDILSTSLNINGSNACNPLRLKITLRSAPKRATSTPIIRGANRSSASFMRRFRAFNTKSIGMSTSERLEVKSHRYSCRKMFAGVSFSMRASSSGSMTPVSSAR